MNTPLGMVISLIAAAPSLLYAGTYVVDVAHGDDSQPGTREHTFKTIAKAILAARPGDTVEIVKVDFPIRETIIIQDKSGESGRPIVVDGKGNQFTGSDPLIPEAWTEVTPGVFRNDRLIPGMNNGSYYNSSNFIIPRCFMLWKSVQNRMGRSSKGFQPPLPKADQLKTGEWTYAEAENAFYIAIDPGKKLSDYQIEMPVRLNVVSVIGNCLHWVVRNVNATHVINDGFNIHGSTRDFVFENITATECGDDGISAHDDSEIAIHGMVSRRNSTGMAHISTIVGKPVCSTCDHLVLEDNYAYNLLLENGLHRITNSLISAAAPKDGKNGIRLMNELKGAPHPTLTVQFANCQIPFPSGSNPSGQPPFRVDPYVKLGVSPDTRVEGDIAYFTPKL